MRHKTSGDRSVLELEKGREARDRPPRVTPRVRCLLLGATLALPGCGRVDPPPPPIVPASAWGSQPQPIPAARRHDPVRITIHHAGVDWNVGDDPFRKLPALQRWGQRDRGWPDVPYHFLIAPDGRVFAGRSLDFEGETNTEYDVTGHALVQLWGNFEVQRVTQAQLASTARLCAWLCATHDIAPDSIATHRDWSKQTTCPGKDLYRYVAEGDVQAWVEALLDGGAPQIALREPLPDGPSGFVPK